MSEQILTLANQLTFDSVNRHLANLHACLSGSVVSAVVLDLQAVTACDSAGLALLIEMKRWCKQQQKTFQMISVPPTVAVLAQFCGVEDLLQEKG